MASFVHLHLHTQYSLLDGAIKIKDLVKKILSFGMKSVAITDHGNMYGVIDFYKQCKKAGIKPIIGCEAYITPKDMRKKEKSHFHIVLLAKNYTGYKNLMYLITKAHLEGFYYHPRIDYKILAEHSEGLIGMSACLAGEIPRYILSGNMDKARETVLTYKKIFEPGSFFLEVQPNKLPEQERVNPLLAELAHETNTPLVATNDSHYLNKEDAYAHEVLLCIQTGKKITDEDRMKYNTDELYLKSGEEIARDLKDYPEAIENTLKIAEMCNVEIPLREYKLPVFKVPEGETTDSFFEKVAKEGLKRRFRQMDRLGIKYDRKVYEERLNYEIEVIKELKFPGYFLIVYDFINYAKRSNIPVGPGRGSAAGSLVSYCMGITEIDPIKYNLLFERFLNKERISMPDIDVDFCKVKRDEVIKYVTKKYGKNNVSQIITFGTLGAKMVLRDVARVLGYSYQFGDVIAKLVPARPNITLEDALKENPKLQELIDKNEDYNKVFRIAEKLEGLCRQAGIHAAGIIIADKELWEYVPLSKGQKGEVITQYAKDEAEDVGLVKFDFLGLKTLTVIDNIVKLIKKTRNVDIDINSIPLDDRDTYRLLSKGETIGVFQLESVGFQEMLKRLKPDRFEDIVASVALYRPGPIESGMIDDFIKRKHGEKKITYPMPQLEEVLKETYGTVVYQEQVMKITTVLAGYTMGEADELRKGIGKKKKDIMEKHREKFFKQATERGVPPEKAQEIINIIYEFGKYGFNKSHSAAYAMISYQTAYLKAHYPIEFMAMLLTSEKHNTDKIIKYINECHRMGIKVLPPDINLSDLDFTVDGDKIRFGLEAVKNVGSSALKSIIDARKEKKFTSLFDFCERVDLRKVNRKVIEGLTKAGAFDSFGVPRAVIFETIDKAIQRAQKKQQEREIGQGSLFDLGFGADRNMDYDSVERIEYVKADPWSSKELLKYEREAIGLYLSDHPLKKYRNFSREWNIEKMEEAKTSQEVEFPAIVVSIVEKRVKNKEKSRKPYGVCVLEDLTGHIDAIIFGNEYEKYSELLVSDEPLLIKGTLKVEGDNESELKRKVLIKEVELLDEVYNQKISAIQIKISDDQKEKIKKLKDLLRKYQGGKTSVIFIVKSNNKRFVIKASDEWKVNYSLELYSSIEQVLGRGSIDFGL